jgi:hypothetical protein
MDNQSSGGNDMKRSLWAATVALLALPFIVSGCMLMHAGMGDMMGHGSGHGNHPSGSAIIKEVEKDGLKIMLEVPPLASSQEATLLVKVVDANSGFPRSNARVRVRIAPSPKHDSSHGGTMTRPSAKELEATEGKDRGVYEVKHIFDEPGSYEITAFITVPEAMSSPAEVSVVQEVAHKKGPLSKEETTWLVLGGVGMGLMMVLMIL